MQMKQWLKRAASLTLAALMVVGVLPASALAAGEVPALLSVQEGINVSVSYGTDADTAKLSLPTQVAVEVEDLSPLAAVEPVSLDFDGEGRPGEMTYYSDKITVQDGKLHFANDTNIKATMGSEDLTDYVVEAELQCVEETPTADYGIMFRTTEASGDGPDSYHGLYVGLGVLDFNAKPVKYGLKVGYADGYWHDIKMYEYELDAKAVNTLRVVVYKNTYTVFVKRPGEDFVKVISATQDIYENGCVGLRSYKQGFDADSFSIRAVTEADLEACGIVPSVSMNAKVESWTADPAYDPNEPGSYTFTGTLAESDAFTNEENRTVEATVTVKEMPEAVNKDHAVPFSQVEVNDDFWALRQKQMVCEVIPTAMENISKSGGGLNNFKLASEYLATKEGEYTTENAPMHEGAKYVDSDVWKVIESMAYALQLDAKGDSEMLAGQAYIRQKLNEWIPWFVGSQEADGYLYTAFTLASNNGDCPDSQMRFTGRSDDMPVHTDGSYYETVGTAAYDESVDYDDHELYCMGHFYEAAVAHYRATGNFRLLDVAVKNADLVARTFGYDDKTQVQAVPGHQEIELALIKLAEVCLEIGGEYAEKAASYVEVARFFLDQRGHDHDGWNDAVDNKNLGGAQYCQDDVPVAAQRTAYGHCVRAQYMYTGMADVALMLVAQGEENPYDEALNAIWEDVRSKQYINGGVGVAYGAESFGNAYELPNNMAYCETCAQISNAMWNLRMNLLYKDSKYADVIENNLYNSIISCVNLDGNQFFYGNPMQSDNGGLRSDWFGTACCPPNLMRTVCSIGGYIYTQDADGDIAVNQYIGNSAEINVGGTLVNFDLETDMPWYGNTTFTVSLSGEKNFSVRFRVPDWATGENTFKVNGEAISATPNEYGYVEITRTWKSGDKVEISFPMEATRVYSDERITTNEGLVAVRRGPILYAAEQVDNTVDVAKVELTLDATLTAGELTRLTGRTGGDHYGVEEIIPITATITQQTPFGDKTETLNLIPYYAWGNRGTTVMRVYLHEGTGEEKPLEYYATVSANYTNNGDFLSAINDGIIDYTDAGHNRWTAYNSDSTNNWVEYAFEGEVQLKGCWVMWYHDGGGVQSPTALSIQYWDGEAWQEVSNMTNGDQFPQNNATVQQGEQYYGFDPITTTKIRLYPTNENERKGWANPGIMEWRLDGEAVAPTTYTITVDQSANGTISPAENQVVTEGSSVTFTITPNEGYEIADVLVDNVSVGKAGSYTFTDVNANHTITASFTEIPVEPGKETYTVTLDPNGGSVSEKTFTVEDGETVNLPTPYRTGYRFLGWFDQDGEQITSATPITKDMTLTARWQYTGGGTHVDPVEPSKPTEPSEPEGYTDVAVGQWYYEAVSYVTEEGLMTGVGSGRFDPNGAVTRAMVWTVLARMDGENTDGGATWYSRAQEWAMRTGVSDGTNPMGSITREQLAAMLYRYAGSPAVSGNLSAYPDASTVSDWAVDAMVWATEEGIINGMNGYLKPQDGATRAQLAAMLQRTLED